MSQMRRTNHVIVGLTDEELAWVNSERGKLPKSRFLRERAFRGREGPEAPELPSHEESVRILAQMAQEGRVGAAIALEKALRSMDGDGSEEEKPRDWFDELSTRRQSVSS
jgi:hypothetical protein